MSRTTKEEVYAGGRRLVKTTVLPHAVAYGDCECFCFDDRDPGEREQLETQCDQAFATEQPGSENAFRPLFASDDVARTYPNQLLPDHQGRRGTWTIVVTFEPEEPLP